jgi:hypothetical protein
MSTVGVGWIIWRSQEFLPKELIFELHYLGQTDYSFNMNFSRPAHPILGQMFNCGFAIPRGIIIADTFCSPESRFQRIPTNHAEQLGKGANGLPSTGKLRILHLAVQHPQAEGPVVR